MLVALDQNVYLLYKSRPNVSNFTTVIVISFEADYLCQRWTWVYTKQWPLAPNLQDLCNTCAHLASQVTSFSKIAYGECRQVWRVLAKLFPNVGQFGMYQRFPKKTILAK
jgi:hypothetical protein